MANFAPSFLINLLIISLTISFATSVPNLSNVKPIFFPKIPKNLRHELLEAALNSALLAHKLALAVNTSTFDPKTKAAWVDCLELCDTTIYHLNQSLGSSSDDDIQTWLSASLTNQDTCKTGFIELGSTFDYIASPFMSTKLSDFITKALAHNKKPSGGNRRLLSDGFPGWVSSGDRKLLQSSSVKADLVVAKDGSGNYETISDAVTAAAKLSKGSRFVIYVKAGVYKENVKITRKLKNIMLIGDGIDRTVVTASKNVQDGSTTYKSATFATMGNGFIAKNITFQNTAGAVKHQAVALLDDADFSVFYQCSFQGYQDTLYVHSLRQFYRNCDIYGTVDFIFGNAAVVLQNCNIYVRKPMSGQQNTITAQGRTDPNQNTGISVHLSVITASSDLKPVQSQFKTYLGRPWKEYSRTVFMLSSLDSLIDPAGWLAWSGDFALKTLYYGEYKNTGTGSDTSKRVNWPGYHVINSTSVAGKFTVGGFISGDSWIPATGVPYTSGL